MKYAETVSQRPLRNGFLLFLHAFFRPGMHGIPHPSQQVQPAAMSPLHVVIWPHVEVMWRLNIMHDANICCSKSGHSRRCVLQGQKGKKAASATASLHPDILEQQGNGDGDDSSAARVQKEIEITSVLIQRFVEHNDTWDRLQVLSSKDESNRQ